MKLRLRLFYFCMVVVPIVSPQFANVFCNDVPDEFLAFHDDKNGDPGDCNREHLFPVGWSSNGKFAYVKTNYSDGKGNTEVSLLIQDLRTDSTLAIFSEEYFGDEGGFFKDFWRTKKKQISRILNDYGIIQSAMEFQKLPLLRTGDTISMDIQQQCSGDSLYGMAMATSSEIRVKSRRMGIKKIMKKSNDDFCGALAINGCFVSPYEPRAAVLLSTYSPGWEGQIGECGFRLIGCHLLNGYSKK